MAKRLQRATVLPQVALRALGFPVKKADVLDLLRKQAVDESQTDKLDFETFKAAVAEKLSERTPQACSKGA